MTALPQTGLQTGCRATLGRRLGRSPAGALFRWAAGQAAHPRGMGGRLMGWILANRPSNLERNRWAVELLDVQPGDWVLELGFGPGIALGWLAERAGAGLVVGIERSELMLRQAARRNAEAIHAGRMTLQLADVERLPDLGTGFDRILAVNVAHFWRDPRERISDLRGRLRPGGVLALAEQPRFPGATDADARRGGERLLHLLREADFAEARLELRPMRPVAAACALGRR
jgi:SAM-dependent methyltransferase